MVAIQLLGNAKRVSSQDTAVTPLGKRAKGDAADSDDNDDTAAELTCPICREILHDAISVLPCLHTFCAGCYSQWHDREATCPDCRGAATKVQRYVG